MVVVLLVFEEDKELNTQIMNLQLFTNQFSLLIPNISLTHAHTLFIFVQHIIANRYYCYKPSMN